MAIAKIRAEMDQNKSNSSIQRVGNFLLQHLSQNPQDTEKVLNPDKTITKSLDEMRKVAEKQRSGNVAVLPDEEGFEIILKYFGIKSKLLAPANEQPSSQPVVNPPEVKRAAFDVNLEDLLG